jgi:hypothetical protein
MSSIHGNQYILPLFIRSDSSLPSLSEDEEFTLAFHLLTKDLPSSHKILSFSRLVWPLLSIQGVISTHIILDGLKIFSKKGKFTNPPRQPLIGHILRNIDNKNYLEILERIENVLTYEDKEAKEVGEGEESEYQVFKVEGLTNPEFLESLSILIPKLEYLPIGDYMPLDASLTTDQALDIAEQYRGIIDTLKGNAYRWESQIELIKEKIDNWLIELNVEIKDIESRYSSEINKMSIVIDEDEVEERMKKEHDKIDQWEVNQKKKLIESISLLFKTLNREFEGILKKNRFFSNADTLKRRPFNQLISNIDEHFNYLKEKNKELDNTIQSLNEQYKDYKAKGKDIEQRAADRLKDYEQELKEQLTERNKKVSETKEEMQKKLALKKELKNKIETKFGSIKKIILAKKKDCLREAEQLKEWSLKDDQSELFAKPIQWIYMPLYAMFIEDEDMMEEYMNIVLPGHIRKEPGNIYDEATEALKALKDFINEKIEDDMVIRSNFEFSCENKNILEFENLSKRMQKGLSGLRSKKIIDESIENQIRQKFDLI